jgi:DNA-binding LacI/PurR family transcriptional regulator
MTGLSRGTISRALHGHEKVDPKTRELVRNAAEKIGYVPHRSVTQARMPETCRYGLLLPNLTNPYYGELIQCLDAEVRPDQRTIVLSLHYYDVEMFNQLLRHWLSGETDGVVLDAPNLDNAPHLIDFLRSRDMPVVFLHGRPADDFCVVQHSRANSFRRAMRQLHDLGHRRIAYIGTTIGAGRISESFIAYTDAMKEYTGSVDEDLVFFGRRDAASGYEALLSFRRVADPPTAIICFNDILACGVAQGARQLGLSIPGDLSLVGCDDISEIERMDIATIQTDRAAMAKAVYRLLEAQRIRGSRLSEMVRIPSEFVLRGSIGPVAKTARI